MEGIIGIVPGAGIASRIGGFTKGLTPISEDSQDIRRFVVVSQQIIEDMFHCGIAPIYFGVNHEKNDITRYYNRWGLFKDNRLYFKLQGDINEYYGMPFAIDAVYEDAKDKTVVLGMPDTIIEPRDSFKILLDNFLKHKANLELGLFRTKGNHQGGYIQLSSDNTVLYHIDKLNANFPWNKADNTWAIACWDAKFTEFMHAFITEEREKFRNPRPEFGNRAELLFGDLIDQALLSKQIRVCADFVNFKESYYLDISNVERYCEAVLHYHNVNLENKTFSGGTEERTIKKEAIFISHSNLQGDYANKLYKELKILGYDPKIDTYDVDGGDEFLRKITRLIRECDFFVLLISKDTLKSPWVQTELAIAHTLNLIEEARVVPVQIESLTYKQENSSPIIPKNRYKWLKGMEKQEPASKQIDSLIKKSQVSMGMGSGG